MRCRHFTLRLAAQHAHADEARLNDFLETVAVRSVQTSAGAPGCWSVLVFYEEEAPQEGRRSVPGTVARRKTSAASPGRPKEPAAPELAAGSIAMPLDAGAPELSPDEQRVYDRLREWRSQRASAEGKPPYVIANNAVLMQIARRHMSIKAAEDLLGISQLGPARAARYGPDILQLLAAPPAPDEAPLFDDER